MTRPERGERKSGMLASLTNIMAPPDLPEDDGKPIVPPRAVNLAAILLVLGGLLFLFPGAVTVLTLNPSLADTRATYAADVAECAAVGGIGASVMPTPTPDQQTLVDKCKAIPAISEDSWASFHTQALIVGILFVVLGLASIVSGWYARAGKLWARRVIVAVLLCTMVAAVLLQTSNVLTLLGTLALVVSAFMLFTGKGALYFLRLSARRRPA